MVIFCSGAVEGDTVKAKIVSVKRNFAEATAEEIISPSKYRCPPLCPHFGKCGGCTFSNVTYEHELKIKKAGIEGAFRRCGAFSATVSDIIYGKEYYYRNKAVFRFDENKNIGFFAKKTNDFIKTVECLNVNPAINIIMREVENLLKSDSSVKASELTYLYIRYMQTANEASVVIGYTGKNSLSRFADALTNILPNVKCVMQGKEKNPESKKEKLTLLKGTKHINAVFSSLHFKISPESFFQINHEVAEKICTAVAENASLRSGDTFLDLYCGTGIIGLTVASKYPSAKTVGIEINPEAVKNAVATAKANGIKNAEFHCCDSAEAANIYSGKIKCLAVDPPRAGLSVKALHEILSISPDQIIYVSCNPSTLSRDIKNLLDNYKIEKIIAADLFPRTSHVETVALLSRQKVEEHIYFDVNVEDLPKTARTTATYPEIKTYIKDKYGFNVTSLNIAQMKEKYGFEKRENYNKGKEDHRVPNCPPEKEKAIEDAFRHFGML